MNGPSTTGARRTGLRRVDPIVLASIRLAAGASAVVVVLVAGFVLLESVGALRAFGVVAFLSDAGWQPTEGHVGLGPMVAATVLLALGATALATPLGLLSALFATHYAPAPLASLQRRIVELLAGVPSVVFGFWGLVVLVPLVQRLEPPGASLLSGILVLAVMILPLVALFADAAISDVPADQLRAAAALGLDRGATLRRVVLPAARGGIATGVLLAAARAVGETMAVLMVCGNVVRMPESVFDPVRALTANIALEMAYATGAHRSALFATGLLLLAVVAALVLGAERLRGRAER